MNYINGTIKNLERVKNVLPNTRKGAELAQSIDRTIHAMRNTLYRAESLKREKAQVELY